MAHTDELFPQLLVPVDEEVLVWVRRLPGPATVAGDLAHLVVTAPCQWERAAVDVVAKCTPTARKPSGHGPLLTLQGVLEQAGCGDIAETYAAQHMWALDTFIGYPHSTSLASKAARGQDADALETELRQPLLALERSGLLRETAGFSCLTARRPHQADSATRAC